MSTLTKVLIVLLSLFSIFLCGIVVTYVANAENQRERADKLQREIQGAQRSEQSAQETLAKQKEAADAMQQEMGGQVNTLKLQVTDLKAQIDKAMRENTQLLQKVTDMAAVVKSATQTAEQQTQLFETAQQEVATLRADQSSRTKELQETDQLLMEKMAVVAQLETKVKQLLENKQELETRLNQYLQQAGRVATTPKPFTLPRTIAQPAQPATAAIGLSGRVTAVDTKNSLAAISIGTASGVKPDMKFYVTRGEQFICNILILDVDADTAVGILDLVQAQPTIGDVVTTNL